MLLSKNCKGRKRPREVEDVDGNVKMKKQKVELEGAVFSRHPSLSTPIWDESGARCSSASKVLGFAGNALQPQPFGIQTSFFIHVVTLKSQYHMIGSNKPL